VDVTFSVDAPDIDESPRRGERAVAYVERLAKEKALAVALRHRDELVIAADTTVVLDGQILGKPADDADAVATVRLLSGRTHHVLTGLAVSFGDTLRSSVCETGVTFRLLSEPEIAWYVATGEPHDPGSRTPRPCRAGAFVAKVDGNVQNVIGLPLADLAELLSRLGLTFADLRA
jgi:septum formation protein